MVKEERIRGGLAMSIIAIVLAEVVGRISDAGFLQDGHVARLLKVLLYAAGLLGYPTAFFLLGANTVACLQRSRVRLLKSVALTVLYPYLLWSILQMAVQWLVADYKDYPAQQFELSRLAWAPIGQFWFLYALFICQIVAIITVWPRCTTVRCALTVVNRGLIVAMILASAVIAIRSHWGIVTLTCWGLVFFLSGGLLTAWPTRQDNHASGVYVAWALAIAFGAAAFMGQRFGHRLDLYALVTSFLGIAAALWIGRCLPIWQRSRWIELIGLTWKPVYLMHVLATALVWNALLAFGIGQPVVHVVLGTAAGLALPIAIYVLAKRLRITSWAGFAETAPARSNSETSSGNPAPRADKSAKSRV